MTSVRSKKAALLATLALLAGCAGDGQDELREWMAQLRADTRPRALQITEPKQFVPTNYVAESAADPFSPQRLTQALRRDSAQPATNAALIAPEMTRRKEPLEAYPLDAIRMVGSLNKTGVPTALVSVDRLLYQVRVGDHLGQHYGKIVAITETAIELREIVQDASGDWIERTAKLELQEASGEKRQ